MGLGEMGLGEIGGHRLTHTRLRENRKLPALNSQQITNAKCRWSLPLPTALWLCVCLCSLLNSMSAKNEHSDVILRSGTAAYTVDIRYDDKPRLSYTCKHNAYVTTTHHIRLTLQHTAELLVLEMVLLLLLVHKMLFFACLCFYNFLQ